MNKIYTLIALILSIGTVSYGQITLTGTANNPFIGMTNSYLSFDVASMTSGADGANQTWDFSMVTGTGPVVSTMVDASTLTQAASFPTANIGTIEPSSGSETYYITNSNEYSMAGNYNPGSTQDTYTDQREFVKFPITYLDVFNETFSGTQEQFASGVVWNRGGDITITASGYGDLILPYGTVSNVLKISVVTNYSDTWMTTTIDYIDSMVLWYNASAQNYICSWDHFYFSGSLMASVGFYSDQATVSSLEDFTPRHSISVFPNPAINNVVNLFVDSDQSDLMSASIYDVSGKMVKQVSSLNNGTNTVPTSDLTSGLYTVRFSIDQQIIRTEKLVIQ